MGGLGIKNNQVIRNAFTDAVERTGTISAAIDETGVSRSSVYRLMANDEKFSNQVSEARLKFTRKMSEDFQEHAPEALETLLSVIRDAKAPATAKVNASRLIIDYAQSWGEALDIDEQIKRLKEDISEAERSVVNG